MFTPKLNTSRSRYSPFNRDHAALNSSKIFTNEKKTHSYRRSVNVSLQTSVLVEQGNKHTLESYGGTLPVLVTESIALAERNTQLNIHLEESGWAVLICSAKLLIWNHKSRPPGKASLCRELRLPPSELGHPAQLIHVWSGYDGATSATSCLTVTPQGIIRFWQNIAHAGAFTETSIDLKGEECAQLISCMGDFFVLVTTTSTLVVITLSGQGQLNYRNVREPMPMYAGISRRMSSFIFGANTPGAGQPLRKVLSGEMTNGGQQALYILTATHLNKWKMSNKTEKLLYQCDVNTMVRECMANEIWNQDPVKLHGLKTWLVDMCSTSDGVVVLAAAVNEDVGPEIHYALGMLHTEGDDPPQSFLSFVVSNYNELLEDGDEKIILRFNMLLPDSVSPSIYVYDTKSVLCFSRSQPKQSVDKVEFQAPGDKLLGAGVCENEILFFSNNHGLLRMKESKANTTLPLEQTFSDSVMDQSSMHETSLGVNMSNVEELSLSQDKVSRLKAAFIHSCKSNVMQSQAIVEDIFSQMEAHSEVDKLVVDLSREMVNDFPASDPRWAETVPQDSASNFGSLLLLHQLEDKLKAHECFVNFLKQMNIWDKLSVLKISIETKSTHMLLCEHAEKIMATIALRNLHGKYRNVVDRAIGQVLEERGQTVPPSGLTPQDVFYRQVSQIDDIFEALQNYQTDVLGANITPREVVATISTVNSIFSTMLHHACQYRQSSSNMYLFTCQKTAGTLWTASGGPHSTRLQLMRQHQLTIDSAIPTAQDNQQKGMLLQQLMELTDLLLNSFKEELEVVRQATSESQQYAELKYKYEVNRKTLIQPFVLLGQLERAASLAEKYCDFEILVQLCEETNNEERLNRYMNQFQNRGIHDFVFKYYMEEGRRGKLLSSLVASHPQLGRLLSAEGNEYLSWLHCVHTNNFGKAHETLHQLAISEMESVAKKKTLLSLSKLAALAFDEAPSAFTKNKEELNMQLDLILHQETLPDDVVKAIGMDPDNMKVLSAQQLIELYTGHYNMHSTCHDFKKALDLLQFIDRNQESEYDSLLLHIWSKAVLKDQWSNISTDDPIANCKDTVFFRTLELACTEGMDLGTYLPSVDRLLESPELTNVCNDANSQFLLRAVYEQLQWILMTS